MQMDMPDYQKVMDYVRRDKERNPPIVLVQNKANPNQMDVVSKENTPIVVTDIIPYEVLKKALEDERNTTPPFKRDRIPQDWNIEKPESGIGYVVEQSTDDGYKVRITDSNRNKRADRYDLLDRHGNMLLSLWRNDKTTQTLYESALPGTATGLGSPRPTTTFDWESLDDVLQNPEENGFEVVEK